MTDTVEEYHAKRRAAAAEAMARGQDALAATDIAAAARWLDRARRISGGNDAVSLLLATVRLRQGDADAAATLFAELARRHDLKEAWLGLASACHQRGDAHGAAAALTEALSGHAGDLPVALHPLADAIAAAAGAPGWCHLTARHGLGFGAARPKIAIALDGVILRRLPGPLPAGARSLAVTAAGRHLLGSPIELTRIDRLDAFVDEAAGGLSGFAWHPNDPARIPSLRVIAADGGVRAVGFDSPTIALPAAAQDRPLANPRPFRLGAADLPGPPPYRVAGAGDRDIPGSPIDPTAAARYVEAVIDAAAGRPAAASALLQAPVPAATIGRWRPPPPSPAPGVAVIVPVYRNRAITLACLHSLFAHTPSGTRVIVVDDVGPEPDLAAALDALAAGGRIELIRHARNRGFPAAANTGLRAAGRDDAVLLNADTLLPAEWLPRLRAAACAAPETGTATPFSNDATLLSYPIQQGGNPVPSQAEVDRLARLAHAANAGRTIDIPTAIGFCMYIRRACLDQVGLLREDVFAQGYGEENDFCLRALACGWRHVAAPGVFVGHVGGVSFGAARAHLLARNLATLNRLHPGYDALIAADAAGTALAAARRRIDLAALAAARRPRGKGGAVLLITHDMGGGVQRQLDVRCAELRDAGATPIVIKPVLARPLLQGTGECRVELDPALPNLIYHVATELPELLALLAARRPVRAEIHHMLGHDQALLALPSRLGIPYDVHLHDYAWFCPRVTLVNGERRYCGEPDLRGCEACIADAGRNIDDEIPVPDLVARSARDLGNAARVVAPAADVAARYARHFPGLRATVAAWDDARPARIRRPPPASAARPRIVGVLGAIGIEKGYDVLLACARDAAARALPLRFTVLGHTTDDARLLATGCVFITGEYEPDELAGLIALESADLALLPSIWPETWCFTLSEAWRAGLHVVAFDIGAPAERIRQHGGGTLVPLACQAPQLNGVLLQ